ncbi:MAG: D-alanyl-D-alanine carboxypeptidase/D-alanyl-D-alanine-endopeptidase [Ferruginibacter sp.]
MQLSFAQPVAIALDDAIHKLEADEQFRHAVTALYVLDAANGKIVYDHNGQTGLAPASCQKIITSASAFDLLGKDYVYQTRIGYAGSISDGLLKGALYIIPSGDPSLGSWRWNGTTMEAIRKKLQEALQAKNIKAIEGDIEIMNTAWETQATPRGWIWEDIGNYYGAGARLLNWHENQYDLVLQPGKAAGDRVAILRTTPLPEVDTIINELLTGPAGSGDNSILYLPEEGRVAYFRGTVPAGKTSFTVGGALPAPAKTFTRMLAEVLNETGIRWKGQFRIIMQPDIVAPVTEPLLNISSPVLDSINYWFLRKSVNLFGEAFVKTIAYEKRNIGSTDTGTAFIRQYWKERGIEASSLKILDGSGLSPGNRVTAAALAAILRYARQQRWFASFYAALPEINGVKMKDGYINGVRSYAGYIQGRSGVTYCFCFIVNNFDGSPGTAREKIWKLLDILK